MNPVKPGYFVLLSALAWTAACSVDKGTATTPSPSPTTTFLLSGRVSSSENSAPITGATLSIVDGRVGQLQFHGVAAVRVHGQRHRCRLFFAVRRCHAHFRPNAELSAAAS